MTIPWYSLISAYIYIYTFVRYMSRNGISNHSVGTCLYLNILPNSFSRFYANSDSHHLWMEVCLHHRSANTWHFYSLFIFALTVLMLQHFTVVLFSISSVTNEIGHSCISFWYLFGSHPFFYWFLNYLLLSYSFRKLQFVYLSPRTHVLEAWFSIPWSWVVFGSWEWSLHD
jgi:hypothetical protein